MTPMLLLMSNVTDAEGYSRRPGLLLTLGVIDDAGELLLTLDVIVDAEGF
jgi:hypothetical protein